MKNEDALSKAQPDSSNESVNSKSGCSKDLAARMWAPVKLKLHPNYNYANAGILWTLLYYFVMLAGMPWAYLVFKLRWRLKIINKKNAKLVKGMPAITVANHVHNMAPL